MIKIAAAFMLLFAIEGTIASEGHMKHTIQLSGPKIAAFGEGVTLTVAYKNLESVAWKLARPEVSLDTILRYEVKGIINSFQGSSLGKTTITESQENGEIVQVRIVPDQPMIEISKETPHEFNINFNSHLVDAKLGVYAIWLEQTDEKVCSNKIEIKIRFEEASVPLLINVVTDASVPDWRRKDAVSWLKKIQPSFDYQISSEANEKVSASNTNAIDALKAFWNMAEKKEILKKVNGDR